ncbi:PilZ domain-containing protein [Qipengyuania sediminis]|uniref:PilZ domain-containing protein n=1 Tax=Qipengyuania sediminis TaxID=1532023 RepID=UPI0010592226|nr:PilZ domain-containing protein [Qipengyuania sediminis]
MRTAPRPVYSPAGFPVQRGHARARLGLAARLVTFSGTSACRVVDLSCSGARIAGGQPVKVGAMVVVEGLPIELFGTVVWVDPKGFGFRFDTPLAQDTVVAMRHHADLAPRAEHLAQVEHARRWVQGRD